MSNKNVTFEKVDKNNLSENDFISIAELEKDIWAYSIGEYIQCKCCNSFFSKNDIFGHLCKEIREDSVSELEKIFFKDNNINCKKCGSSNTEFIYDIESNIKMIKDRLLNSISSQVVFLKKDDNLIGLMDGYYDSLENIYKREFEYRYDRIGYEGIKEKLGGKVDHYLYTFSTFGILEKYNDLNRSFLLFKNFFELLPEDYLNSQLIVELDIGKFVHSFYSSLGIKKVGFENNRLLRNRGEDYNSDLFLHDSLLEIKLGLPNKFKTFLFNNRSKIKEVLFTNSCK